MAQQLSTKAGGSTDEPHSSQVFWPFQSRRVNQNTGREGVIFPIGNIPRQSGLLQLPAYPQSARRWWRLRRGTSKGRQGCEMGRHLPRLPGGRTDAQFGSEPRTPLPVGELVVP